MSGYTLDFTLTNRRCPSTFPCGNMLGCGVSSLGCGTYGWSAKPIGSQSQTGPITQSARGADRAFLRRGFGTNTMKTGKYFGFGGGSPSVCSSLPPNYLSTINLGGGVWRATCWRETEAEIFAQVTANDSPRPTFVNQTPFRLSMLAGDPFGSINEAVLPTLYAPNQVARSGISFGVLPRSNGGGLSSGNATYTGNPKWVYDSSDYMRYKKLRAMSQNYNDSSFGGDKHNASQVAISAARRGFSR